MKFTRQQLKSLITEEIRRSRRSTGSPLLEMPMLSSAGTKMGGLDNHPSQDDAAEGGHRESAKNKLYHLGAQAQQLEALLIDDETLDPWVQDKITRASSDIDAAFRAIMASKRPGADMMEE